MPKETPVPHVIYHGTVARSACYHGDRVTVPTLLGHANVQTSTQDDRREKHTKKNAVAILHVPYRWRNG
jgi:hypothetical protein